MTYRVTGEAFGAANIYEVVSELEGQGVGLIGAYTSWKDAFVEVSRMMGMSEKMYAAYIHRCACNGVTPYVSVVAYPLEEYVQMQQEAVCRHYEALLEAQRQELTNKFIEEEGDIIDTIAEEKLRTIVLEDSDLLNCLKDAIDKYMKDSVRHA